MAVSAFAGPVLAYGQRLPLGNAGPTNPDLGPSLFWGGAGLVDPRMGYNVTRRGIIGFNGSTGIPVLDIAPSTLSAVNIAAAQVPVSGTALTLVSSTGAGVTVLAAATVVWPSQTTVPASTLALDSAPTVVAYGTADLSSGYTMISVYDPTKALARNIRITSVGDDSAATALVSGYDIYGYAMSERITLTNASIASGIKAFKFVSSIVPSGTLSGSNASVGTGDVIGLPIRADHFGDVQINYNATVITASTGFTAAVTTSPATTTTGDTRGTYALQTASNGTRRLQVFVTPKPSNVGSTTGLFGVTQA